MTSIPYGKFCDVAFDQDFAGIVRPCIRGTFTSHTRMIRLDKKWIVCFIEFPNNRVIAQLLVRVKKVHRNSIHASANVLPNAITSNYVEIYFEDSYGDKVEKLIWFDEIFVQDDECRSPHASLDFLLKHPDRKHFSNDFKGDSELASIFARLPDMATMPERPSIQNLLPAAQENASAQQVSSSSSTTAENFSRTQHRQQTRHIITERLSSSEKKSKTGAYCSSTSSDQDTSAQAQLNVSSSVPNSEAPFETSETALKNANISTDWGHGTCKGSKSFTLSGEDWDGLVSHIDTFVRFVFH